MAKAKEPEDQAEDAPARPAAAKPPTRTVRAWAKDLDSRRAVVVGAARLKGWTADTEVTEAEFRAALDAYRKRPLGGTPAERRKRRTA